MNDVPQLRKVLREREARAFVGLKPTQFREYVEQGVIPPPIKPHDNARINLWFEDELAEYQAKRAERRNIKHPLPAALSRPRKTP
jgi:predicted DNA-binding transcriptional regulator AlpA